jgi:hypothetical protein
MNFLRITLLLSILLSTGERCQLCFDHVSEISATETAIAGDVCHSDDQTCIAHAHVINDPALNTETRLRPTDSAVLVDTPKADCVFANIDSPAISRHHPPDLTPASFNNPVLRC